MSAGRTTALLGMALAAAVGLDAWLRWPRPAPVADRLPAFDPARVATVRLARGDDAWTLTRSGDDWHLPGSIDADAERVGVLLAGLARGVPLDAQVDRGNYEDYGLAGADPVRVDLLGAGEQSIASLIVGFDAGGGATWVRRPADDAVFRAQIGGRGRYDRPVAAWRDRLVVAVDDLQGLRFERGDGSFALRVGEPWTVEGDPGFEVDPVLIQQVSRVLGHLVALDVATEGGFGTAGDPIARVSLTSPSGTTALRVWPGAVALDGAEVAFRITPALSALLGGPLETWRDRTVWRLDPATVTELRLDEVERVILARQPGGWVVTEPAGVAADPGRSATVVAFLANPRVDGWLAVTSAEAGFLEGSRVVVATGAQRRTIEIGAPVPGRPVGREARYVRDPRRPERIGTWSAATWAQVRAGFGR